MKVRILSGNEAGCVTEVSDTVGESLLATGFAERALETDVTGPVVTVVEPALPPELPVEPPVEPPVE